MSTKNRLDPLIVIEGHYKLVNTLEEVYINIDRINNSKQLTDQQDYLIEYLE
jgi:hypothetical protein